MHLKNINEASRLADEGSHIYFDYKLETWY